MEPRKRCPLNRVQRTWTTRPQNLRRRWPFPKPEAARSENAPYVPKSVEGWRSYTLSGITAETVDGRLQLPTRACSVIVPVLSGELLRLAAFAWAAAFLGFAVYFGPLLLRRRGQRKSGAANLSGAEWNE
jgi:hypothetical protein